MIDYSEKRDFIRMPVRCPIRLHRITTPAADVVAELLDLSAGGMRFVSQCAIETGERLQITVSPDYPITPPLEAEVSVVRCSRIVEGFDIAAAIDLVEPAVYAAGD